MNINIMNLLSQENPDKYLFIDNIDSKLMLDMNKNEIIDDNEWIDQVEFTIPHIQKALEKPNKYIVTEEEVIKIELIKKVSVESIKHLSKHVDLVDEFDEKTQDVKPSRLLNAYKEENFVTYENRFIYSLIKLMEDFIFLRTTKEDGDEYRNKTHQKATYEGKTKLRREKVSLKFEYLSESEYSQKKTNEIKKRIEEIQKGIRNLKTTEIYKLLDSKKVTLVKSPLKMTNVLLKNVHFQYAVRLWNYLNDHLDAQADILNAKNEYEETGVVKDLVNEDFWVKYIIFNTINSQVASKNAKNPPRSKKERDQITEKLIEEIIKINPDILENELQKMVTEKLIIYKRKRDVSLKPLEDAFKRNINKYLDKVQKVKLK